ncbi:MAG: right-handed parallel beta-helix repeat-containing protein [Ferruginibacter sp.]
MKALFLLSFLFATTITYAKNYYISSAGNDVNNGLTAATPWQTITKLNASFTSIVTGDSILFKTGDTFYGTLKPTKAGLVFGSYGTRAKPIITGLSTISAWTSVGTNIWEATVPGSLSTLNMVVINNLLTPVGRYPNANAANDGYRTYSSFTNNSSLTDTKLSSSPNWTGGEIVIRQSDFVLKRYPITNHNSSTLSFTGTTNMNANYGYFVQNHLSALDENGEWLYTAATRKIKIFYNGTPPAIQVSTLPNLVSMIFTNTTRKSQITFTGIAFKGSENTIMDIQYCDYVTIDHCDFSFAGVNAIDHRNMINFLISNSTFTDINMNGLHETNPGSGDRITIQNNNFRRIGINKGMVSTNTMYAEREFTAITIGATNLLVKENTFDSIGYAAISLLKNRNNQAIRRNTITNFCLLLNDGGAIYNSGLRGDPAAANIFIDSNIISKSGDASPGTSSTNKHVRAIYLDATSTSVSVIGNTVFNVFEGIYISQAQKITIRGNTVYDAGIYSPTKTPTYGGAMSINDASDGYQHCRNNVIKGNTFFAKYPNQLLYSQIDRYNGVDSLGIIDSNYYINPMNDYPIYLTNTTLSSIVTPYSLNIWRSKFNGYDKHSKSSPKKIPLFTVNSLNSANKAPNETFASDITGVMVESAAKVHTLAWDNTGKITGTGSARLISNVVSANFTTIFQIVGRVDSAKKYVLRFKTKATKAGSFRASIRQYTGCYCLNSATQSGVLDTSVTQQEVLLSWDYASQSNALIGIEFSQDNSTMYIDDIQFYEATTTPTNIEDYLRFEYNSSGTPKTINLDAKYIGVDSAVYNGSITLQPFTSAVLIKIGTIETTLKASAGNDVILFMPNNSTILNGSTTGTVSSYSWTKVSGPTQFTIADPGKQSTGISNLAIGTYTFRFKVTNSAGDSAIALAKVTVTGVLAVRVIDFTALNNNDKVALSWKVTSEMNVSHYVVERSGNGQTFEAIGRLASGNSISNQNTYDFMDSYPLQGTNFYRLKIVGLDSSISYSSTISSTITNTSAFTIHKLVLSAVSRNIKAEINSGSQQSMYLAIIDVNGRIIFTMPAQLRKGYNLIDKQIPAITTGIYYIKLLTSGQALTRTVISDH